MAGVFIFPLTWHRSATVGCRIAAPAAVRQSTNFRVINRPVTTNQAKLAGLGMHFVTVARLIKCRG
jgi:hypothetical protein